MRRHAPARVLALGLTGNMIGSTGVAVSVLAGLGLPALVGSLFVMVSSLGLVFPNAMAIALADHGEQAGTASSLLGLLQYVVGALVAPLVGIAGEDTAVPLGVVAFVASAGAVLVFLLVVRRRVPADEQNTSTARCQRTDVLGSGQPGRLRHVVVGRAWGPRLP